MTSHWLVKFTGIATLSLAVCGAASAQYGGGGTSGSGGTGGTSAYTPPSEGYSSGKTIGIGVGVAAGAAVGIALSCGTIIISPPIKRRLTLPAAPSPSRTEST